MAWRWRVSAFYGVEDPDNGKRRGMCAITTVHATEPSMMVELAAFRQRADIGWVDVVDLQTNEQHREYMR
ncbi:hypothetical protein ACVMGC_003704 [Bradyrhizobium barranii subsp. barranii]|uniref:Uncharacterized protein n=1 Tax=Bradyrhizobium barranii subsp. barranii TaxID=2823807 RepID=A0A939MER3_9BRAD|nr:hypothetical protein [Bradyrhizobium barranii]UEM11914.1 hypothetical protein J4G43_046985 [Bradyrhizobium barranii subsp. barranii]